MLTLCLNFEDFYPKYAYKHYAYKKISVWGTDADISYHLILCITMGHSANKVINQSEERNISKDEDLGARDHFPGMLFWDFPMLV